MSRVDRTCTEVRSARDDRAYQSVSRRLNEYRDAPAYVLLGDPGAGKTTAFEMECDALADGAHLVDARDFIALDPEVHPEWRGKTLFIDALDEVRIGGHGTRTPFDAIRNRLDKLGRPRFRISCREADWLGNNDRKRLASVAPLDSSVTVLRLDPLDRADAERILDASTGITDSRGFMDEAATRGVNGLLANPLTLRLLADVVSERQWPRSRVELFEQASAMLSTECNEEHSSADPQPPDTELMDAAGRLCAVLLLSGFLGYTLRNGEADGEYPEISQCEYGEHQLLRAALATRLFTAVGSGRFVPIHRHIAEFVGAKHLARVICEGLPASRVVGLLTGYDGGVVTSLRGVAAWLATLSVGARLELLERDPVAVISYGDVQAFSVEHKEILLHALGREDSRINSGVVTESALGAVATRGMEPALRKILEHRNEHPRTLVAIVLYALRFGERLPNVAECLMQVVYGDNEWLQAPAWALEAFIHHCPNQDAALNRLEQLLRDLSAGIIEDWQDQLSGIALHHLYPVRIPPAAIWDYLTESTNRHRDDYRSFWRCGLLEQSKPDHIATLLDALATRCLGLKPALESRGLEEVPTKLLARGLELSRDMLDRSRLLSWLRMDLFSDSPRTSHEAAQRIGAWLQERAEVQKAIIADSVSSSPHPIIDHMIHEILYGSSPPPDFGDWCLRQAREATDPHGAEAYLRLALARDVPLDILLEYEREASPLREIMKQMLVCPLPEGFYDGVPASVTSRQEESRRRRREFVEGVRSHETELRANRGNLHLLDELANVYFGWSSDVGGRSPGDRLRDLFDGDASLIDATLAGCRGAPFRRDVPDTREIAGRLKTGGRYRIALPVLAGIDELRDLRELSAQQLRRALAFHFTTFTENAANRGRRLIESDIAAAAEVFVQCTRAKMLVGNYEHMVGYQLARRDYVALARLAVLPLLRSFPVRCAQSEAMRMLDELFIAAFLHTDRASFLTLVAEKLTRTSMSVAQRVRWLAVQVVVAPGTSINHLCTFVARQRRRVSRLAAFLMRIGPELDSLPTPKVAALIELLGPTVRPWDPTRPERFGQDGAECVRQMVRTLADRPDQRTSDELARLCTEAGLKGWHPMLEDALDRQRVIRRDAAYRHPTVEEVCRTLNAGAPANAGDLAALLTDRFLELARRIRAGNTDDWRQYWNEPRRQAPTPKHEEQCRDALLSDLRAQLPAGVDAQPEGQYANDKRSDIRVVYQDYEVPVEIKKSQHRQLWSAARDQLIGKYASNPATGGYGIYLVFWFGRDGVQPPPEGALPEDPAALRDRLKSTLTEAERRQISVVVIDVSRPEGK